MKRYCAGYRETTGTVYTSHVNLFGGGRREMFNVNFKGTLSGHTYLCFFFARTHLNAWFFPKNTEELHRDFCEIIILLKVINSPNFQS